MNQDHYNSLDVSEQDIDPTLLHIWSIKDQLDEEYEHLGISKNN